jgi:hypothetical protein
MILQCSVSVFLDCSTVQIAPVGLAARSQLARARFSAASPVWLG